MDDEVMMPDYAYFSAVPWCARILSDPSFRIHPDNRDPKPDTEDSFIAETLKTPLTIHAALTMASLPVHPAPMPVHEVRCFFALGTGLNGHAHIAHGGFLPTLFDEATGLLLIQNKNLQPVSLPRPGSSTAYMRLNYRRPVRTPQIILVRAWLKEAKGRKYFIDATMEDAEGHVLMDAETLWVSTTPIQGVPKL